MEIPCPSLTPHTAQTGLKGWKWILHTPHTAQTGLKGWKWILHTPHTAQTGLKGWKWILHTPHTAQTGLKGWKWILHKHLHVLLLWVVGASFLAGAVGAGRPDREAVAAIHGALCLEDSMVQAVLHTHTLLWVQAQCRLPSHTHTRGIGSYQGCHWSFAKITENLRVRAVSHKMNTKRDRKFRKRKMK